MLPFRGARLFAARTPPAPIQLLCGQAEPDDEVTRKVLRFDLASLLLPKTEQRCLVVTHDDAAIPLCATVQRARDRA
jgi:hypothetical protein